jgi:DcuC family C4-dicarboxylate transporter
MLGPIISLLVILIAGKLLLSQFNPQAVLLIAGLGMLVAAFLISPDQLELKQDTGSSFFDFFALVKEAFSKTNAGVGLMIMAIGGFVAYMDHIGASDTLVFVAMKPLHLFKKNPYVLASMVIPISQILFIAIPSAAGLSLLLMASLFKILVQLGVSRIAAAAVITASTTFGIGPACATTASSMAILNWDAVFYFLNYQIPLVWPLSLSMMISFYVVNRYFDRKNKLSDSGSATSLLERPKAPFIYAILPILPIALLIIFSEMLEIFKQPIHIDTTTVMFVSLFIALLFEGIRYRTIKPVMNSMQVFFDGMGNIFKSVITLIIAAELFAQGLIALGFIDGLLELAASLGLHVALVGLGLTIMIFLAAVLMGSGNAAFFSFGPLVPNIATQLGVATPYLLLPMQLAASMGRTISPVSGVLVASAGIAGISPMDIAKRNFIPIVTALIIMMLSHFYL